MSKEDELFTTYDLNLTAVLYALGFPLAEVRKNTKGKALFCFKKSLKLDQVIAKYWKEDLKINPQKLFNSIKSIKNRIYSNY